MHTQKVLGFVKRRDINAYNRDPKDWTKYLYVFSLTLFYTSNYFISVLRAWITEV
jgi:hypothetical protein